MSWVFLFIASIFEICWLLSLKYIEWIKIKDLITKFDLTLTYTLLPLSCYVGFGILNVIFYSLALKTITLSTAFAVWTGVILVGSKLIDIFFFKEEYSISQVLFLGVILIGVAGLKFYSPK